MLHTREMLCIPGLYSSSAAQPKALAITLFLPKKNLQENKKSEEELEKRVLQDLLSFHAVLTSFNFEFLMFSTEKV